MLCKGKIDMGNPAYKFELEIEDEIEDEIEAEAEVEIAQDLNPASPSCDELYQLGLTYWAGRGVTPDYVIAHKWFNLAAMQGSREARDYRAELSAQMSADQIANAQRLAREWLHTRAA